MRQGCQGSQGMVGGAARGPAGGVPECTPLDSALARRQQASSFPRESHASSYWLHGLVQRPRCTFQGSVVAGSMCAFQAVYQVHL